MADDIFPKDSPQCFPVKAGSDVFLKTVDSPPPRIPGSNQTPDVTELECRGDRGWIRNTVWHFTISPYPLPVMDGPPVTRSDIQTASSKTTQQDEQDSLDFVTFPLITPAILYCCEGL